MAAFLLGMSLAWLLRFKIYQAGFKALLITAMGSYG